MPSKHVHFIGWFDNKNLGDDTFRDVFTQYFSEEATLSFSSNVDPQADLNIYGGGGVVYGNYLIGASTLTTPRYALGVDAATNGPAYEAILSAGFTEMILRSKEQVWTFQTQGQRARYTPDLVFSLFQGYSTSIERQEKTICFSLTHELLQNYALQTEVAQGIRELADCGYSIEFLSLYEGSLPDSLICELLWKRSGIAQPFICHIPNGYQEALTTLARFRTVISMRYHGTIFSMMAGICYIAFGNRGKHSLLAEDLLLKNNYLDFQDFTRFKLRYLVDNLHWKASPRVYLPIVEDCKRQVLDVISYVKSEWLSQ